MIEEAIYSILTHNAGVTALVGTKVYPVMLPQETTLPALTYVRVSTMEREVTHSGPTYVTKVVYQLSCWHNTLTGAKQLARAVCSAMHGYSGAVGSERIFFCKCVNEVDAFEQDTGLFHVPIDLLIMHRET